MINNIPPVTRNLLIIIGLVGLAQMALSKQNIDIIQLYLFYPDSPYFKPWQIITHMFCHGGLGHFLFNALALFMFGAVIENRIGTKKFLILFFISGIGAVLLNYIAIAVATYNIIGTAFPYHTNAILPDGVDPSSIISKYGPMLGASGALYGVLVAFVYYYPNEKLIFLFIPYPIKAKYLIPVILLIDVVGGFGQFVGDNIAHFAHLGGALTGFILVKMWSIKKVKNNWLNS